MDFGFNWAARVSPVRLGGEGRRFCTVSRTCDVHQRTRLIGAPPAMRNRSDDIVSPFNERIVRFDKSRADVIRVRRQTIARAPAVLLIVQGRAATASDSRRFGVASLLLSRRLTVECVSRSVTGATSRGGGSANSLIYQL